MITIIYEARGGYPVSDGHVDDFIESLVFQHKSGSNATRVCSTGNVIRALQLAVAEGVVLPHEVNVVFRKPYRGTDENRDVALRIFPDGGIDPWPKGFADFEDGKLMKLIRTGSKFAMRWEMKGGE